MAIALSLILAAAVLCGCSRSADPSPPSASDPVTLVPPARTTVALSPGQLTAIHIEPVGTYPFDQENEAVGSVSFYDDPAVVQAESTLISAAAAFDLAAKELRRESELGATNGISQRALEQAISTAQAAQAALTSARDTVRALGKTDAQINDMIAAGRIDSPAATPGANRWVVANVSESDCALFRLGQPVRVTALAFPGRVFTGKVSRIYATVDPNTHRMAVRCEVDDPKNELRPGMLADVVIQVRPPVASVAVPAASVVREGDGTMTAWVTTDRRHFTQRIVTTGLRENGRLQILKGLRAGELVVTDGAIFLDNMLQASSGD